MKRSKKDHENLVLIVLLALDSTGHGLSRGSVTDLAEMASHAAVRDLTEARLVEIDKAGAASLTTDGRAEARRVAAELAEGHER